MDDEHATSMDVDIATNPQIDQQRRFNETFQRLVAAGDSPTSAAAKALDMLRSATAKDMVTETDDNDGGADADAKRDGKIDANMDGKIDTNMDVTMKQDTQQQTGASSHDSKRAAQDSGIPSGVTMEEKETGVVVGSPTIVDPPSVPCESVPSDAMEQANHLREELTQLIEQANASGSYTNVIRKVGELFSSEELLTDMFAVNVPPDGLINVADVDDTLQALLSCPSEGVANSLKNALMRLVSHMELSGMCNRAEDPGRLRPFMVVLRHPSIQFGDPDLQGTMYNLCKGMAGLPSSLRTFFANWLVSQPRSVFDELLAAIQMFITVKMLTIKYVSSFMDVGPAVMVLDMLYQANDKAQFVPFQEFYNAAVSEEATDRDEFLIRDYVEWRGGGVTRAAREQKSSDRPVKNSFCDYPFVLDPGSKARILQIEARVTQREEFDQAMMQSMVTGRRGVPYVVFQIRREHLVDDALDQIGSIAASELKKPLKVKFIGEEGVDEGGVQKEFFLLMTRRLMDPSYGMFSMDETTRNMWFNANSFEEPMKFELVGLLLGLAIYNSIILDVHFPKVLYKKLLGMTPTLQDLKDAHPELGNGLQKLLDHPTQDVEADFGLTFQLSFDVFGQMQTVDLVENGEGVSVTGDNRDEYVAKYVEYQLTTSVASQFQAFNAGFHRVCGGEPLAMFKPEELELLICGSSLLDFDQLESTARYETYTPDDDVIKDFWSVVHEMDETSKKKLLMFMTGSDRVPIRGLASLRITISKNGEESDRLPTAHTCFNHLLLPHYKTKSVLKERLYMAIEFAEGFGTM